LDRARSGLRAVAALEVGLRNPSGFCS
jgi:hypothetical protein